MIEVKHIETKEDGKVVEEKFVITHLNFYRIELVKEEAKELYKLLGERLK